MVTWGLTNHAKKTHHKQLLHWDLELNVHRERHLILGRIVYLKKSRITISRALKKTRNARGLRRLKNVCNLIVVVEFSFGVQGFRFIHRHHGSKNLDKSCWGFDLFKQNKMNVFIIDIVDWREWTPYLAQIIWLVPNCNGEGSEPFILYFNLQISNFAPPIRKLRNANNRITPFHWPHYLETSQPLI